MDNDGFFMNVNTNVSASALRTKSATSKKLEKKNKYNEKKLINKKRQRNTTIDKNNDQTTDNEIDENKNKKNYTNQIYTKKNFLDYNNQKININEKNTEKNSIIRNKSTTNQTSDIKFHKNFDANKNKNYHKKNIFIKDHKNNGNSINNNEENEIILELKENKDDNLNKKDKKIENLNEKNIDSYQFKEEPNDDLIDELNEFYSKQNNEKELKPKKLTIQEKQNNKLKIKTMQSEIENEIKEINTQAALEEEAKEKARDAPIDYNASVFSLKDFQDLDISPYLKRVLKKENFTIMTKIQKKSIPILLKHRDVVVKSETGSGKTLAYVIPIYDFLINLNLKNKIQRKDGVYVVIFAPTHELCLQIEATFDKLKSACINAVFGSLMGGQSIETEKARLRKGLNVIITTPGRMLYHLNNTSTLSFMNLKMFVFDEADILLNMGFEKDIKECMRLIFNKFNTSVPENLSIKIDNKNLKKNNENEIENDENNITQIVEKSENLSSDYFKKFKIFLISATIDNKIRKMADFLMKGFKTVGFEIKKDQENNNIKNKKDSKKNASNELVADNQKMMEIIEEEDYETFTAPANLVQEYSIVFDEFRLIHLLCQVFNNVNKKLIIFVSCCDTVNFLQEFLTNFEFNLEHIIKEGEVGVGFNKYKNKEDLDVDKNKKILNSKKDKFIKNANNNYDKNDKKDFSSKEQINKKIKLINNPILKLHGKMSHEERKKIFKEFNQDKPAILICTDVASRGLDFPHVDLIIHYDINPDPKEYLNRMGRTARLDKSGNSLLFLMKHEEKVLQNSLRKFTINNFKPGSILLNFIENFNNLLANNGLKEKINAIPQAYKDEVDENEKYRKKYIFVIFPLQKSIKDYLFKNREHLINARKAFKSSIRSYVTFLKFQKDVFNVKALNLTRYARSFCLYKESSTVKVGNKNVMVDYETEKKNTKGNKKFNNKKIEKRLLISEFS